MEITKLEQDILEAIFKKRIAVKSLTDMLLPQMNFVDSFHKQDFNAMTADQAYDLARDTLAGSIEMLINKE